MLVDLQYAYPEYQGLRINEAAKLHGKDEFETLFDVLQANKMSGRGVLFTMSEEDVERIISKPYVMIGTDGAGVGMDCVHPRSTSSFTRAIAHYWRERKVCSFPEMIRKMTSLPAQVYKLEGKGEIAVGKDADLCIFDPDYSYVAGGKHLISMGRNTPFDGKELFGLVLYTIKDGRIVWQTGK